ncbi:NEW3 domain-containing protein [Geobacillus stearothermophilus]|nr:hypothetical protein IB49_14165 [Geobacillus sp. LC300]WJQ00974.1 NEW3 domain-containing protein [Geobacillus stearothermophilus]WJQ04385.1 NEW3 domain-containing protein [Geobacillus stearothermophilus]
MNVVRSRVIMMFAMILTLFSLLLPIRPASAASSVVLFTPYTGLSVTPGETIDYTVNVINNGSNIENVTFSFDHLPKGWSTSITAEGRTIEQLSVRGGKEEEVTLEVTVPLDADKGDYRFWLVAKGESGSSKLPLLVRVTEQGSFKTELTSEQTNLEGHVDSSFTYDVTLKNRTAKTQNYALSSAAEKGWQVTFKSEGNSVTSVKLEPNESRDITVEVKPPENVKAGTYKIPIKAQTSDTSAELTLEAVITGTYALKLTTPSGNLSTDVTAGHERVIDLVVKNTGSAPLLNINMTADAPPDWEVEFDQSTIAQLNPGDSKTVKAKVKASDEAIAGDYVVNFQAQTAETSAEAAFRVSVKTSTVWGVVAVLIILGVAGGLYYLIKTYGRR